MLQRSRIVGRLIALLLLLTIVGCDRVTKHVATTHLAGRPPQSYFGDVVQIEYAENTGGLLSFGAAWPQWLRTGIFTIGVGFGLLALAVIALRNRWSGPLLAAASLVLAGGVSNLIDRVTRGSVVDFVSIGLGPIRTGIFNVADVAVMLGLALIVFYNHQDQDNST